jgi:hypothetical protein
MSFRIVIAIAAGLCTTGLFVNGASAEMARAKVERVKLQGCPFRGVEPNCVMMRGPDGRVYSVGSAKPPVPINKVVIRLTGTVSNNPSFCFSTVLKDIRWRPTRMRCPKMGS